MATPINAHDRIDTLTNEQVRDTLHRIATVALDFGTLADNGRDFVGNEIDETTRNAFRSFSNIVQYELRNRYIS